MRLFKFFYEYMLPGDYSLHVSSCFVAAENLENAKKILDGQAITLNYKDGLVEDVTDSHYPIPSEEIFLGETFTIV